MSVLFAVNDDNDIFAQPNGKLALVVDEAAIDQNIKQALKSQFGEMIYNKLEGVDYMGTVFSGFPNIEAFKQSCRKNILRVEGVLSINSFDVFKENDLAQYETTIITIFGQQAINDAL